MIQKIQQFKNVYQWYLTNVIHYNDILYVFTVGGVHRRDFGSIVFKNLYFIQYRIHKNKQSFEEIKKQEYLNFGVFLESLHA